MSGKNEALGECCKMVGRQGSMGTQCVLGKEHSGSCVDWWGQRADEHPAPGPGDTWESIRKLDRRLLDLAQQFRDRVSLDHEQVTNTAKAAALAQNKAAEVEQRLDALLIRLGSAVEGAKGKP